MASVTKQKTVAVAVSLMLYVAMGMLINAVLFAGLELRWPVRFAALPILIWFAFKSHTVILFGLSIASILVHAETRNMPIEFGEHWLHILGILMLLYLSSHLQDIRFRLVEAWLAMDEMVGSPNTADPRRESLSKRSPLIQIVLRIAKMFLKLNVILLCSWLLLLYQPWTSNAASWLSWSISNGQILWPGPTLIVLLLAFAIAFHEWAWRHKSREQWKMFLRSVALVANFPDLRRIAKAQHKSKNKK